MIDGDHAARNAGQSSRRDKAASHDFAECLGHGLAAIAVQECLRLGVGQGVDVAPQPGVFDPAVERMAGQPRVLGGVELARLGRRKRSADLR